MLKISLLLQCSINCSTVGYLGVQFRHRRNPAFFLNKGGWCCTAKVMIFFLFLSLPLYFWFFAYSMITRPWWTKRTKSLEQQMRTVQYVLPHFFSFKNRYNYINCENPENSSAWSIFNHIVDALHHSRSWTVIYSRYHKLLVLFLPFICRLWAVGHVSEGLLLPSYLKYDCVTDNRHKNSELNFERSGIFVSSAYIVSDKTSNNKPVWSLVPMGTKDIFVGFQHALHCWHLWKNDVQHTHSGSKYRIWQERLLHHAEQMSRCDGWSLTRQHHSGVAIKSKCFPAACMPLDDRWITSASFR